MEEITITILKEDILLNNYTNSADCPITRALHRAGYTDLCDSGRIIGTIGDMWVHITMEDKDYETLITKLFGMYNHQFGASFRVHGLTLAPPIPAEDFTITIHFNLD